MDSIDLSQWLRSCRSVSLHGEPIDLLRCITDQPSKCRAFWPGTLTGGAVFPGFDFEIVRAYGALIARRSSQFGTRHAVLSVQTFSNTRQRRIKARSALCSKHPKAQDSQIISETHIGFTSCKSRKSAQMSNTQAMRLRDTEAPASQGRTLRMSLEPMRSCHAHNQFCSLLPLNRRL